MSSLPIVTVALRDYAFLREPEDRLLDAALMRDLVATTLAAVDEAHPRVLVDGRRTTRTYTFIDAYRLVQEFRNHPAFAFARIALLGTYERDFDKTQAVEAFSREAGLDVRAFLDYEKAVRYLCGSDDPQDRRDADSA